MAISHEVRLPLSVGSNVDNESSASAVSWSAILVGAVIAAAISLLLLALGAGMGFASLSPWRAAGPSAVKFTVMSAIWLIVVQWLASGVGGYLTGRLRAKWVGLHTHEVAFRDTAHGFATWAVATIIVSIVFATAGSAVLGGAAKIASGVATTVAETTNDYEVDSLFRSTTREAPGPEIRAQTLRIFTQGAASGTFNPADRAYLVELIASRTGVTNEEAARRLDGAIAQVKVAELKAREIADAARKSASAASITLALSMLIGAFIASVAAALAGSQRDDREVTAG